MRKLIYPCLGLLMMTHSCNKNSMIECEESAPALQEYKKSAPVLKDKEYKLPSLVEDEFNCFLVNMNDFTQNLENLFEIHGILFNNAIVKAYDYTSQNLLECTQTNLFENASQIASLLALVYDSRVAYRFEELLNQDTIIGLQYINAIKANNQVLAKQLAKQAYANGDMLIEFLNIMNFYIALEPERQMFEEHVTLRNQQILAYFEGNLESAEELRDQSIKHLQEMARHIAIAIKRQRDAQMLEACYRPSISNFCD